MPLFPLRDRESNLSADLTVRSTRDTDVRHSSRHFAKLAIQCDLATERPTTLNPFSLDAAIERTKNVDPESLDRPDTVAWVLLAQRAAVSDSATIQTSATRLERYQLPDGSTPVHPETPSAHWPTLVAALAWNGLESHQARSEAALKFVLRSTGKHWAGSPNEAGHDPAIIGWSWISDTHSWVIPTSMAMLAINAIGTPTTLESMTQDRVTLGVDMLLDRQLPDGGWNYGNTVVFRNTLKPLPEETAWALASLAGRISRVRVARSLDYLNEQRTHLIAPVTLAAAMLAWHGWDHDVVPEELASQSLSHQERIGLYPLAMTAQLIACALAPQLILSQGAAR